MWQYTSTASVVALLAEGVDRNFAPWRVVAEFAESPSSRRAWIEISFMYHVDTAKETSPSSRRAWIEMTMTVM